LIILIYKIMSDIEDTYWDDDIDDIEDEVEDEVEDEENEEPGEEENEELGEELDIDDIEDEESGIILHNTFVSLTKYEKTKILGLRARQIELGSLPVIKYSKSETPLEIAERELFLKKIPFKIKRTLPSGKIEIIKLKNLC